MTEFIPLKSGDHKTITNVDKSGYGYLIAKASQTRNQMLVICQSIQQARLLQTQTEFYLGETDTTCYAFADWEILPYDSFSPHQDIISERIELLANLQDHQPKIIFASVNTLLHQLCPTDFIFEHSFQLANNQLFDEKEFRQQLIQAGYQAVDNVYEHGQFAIRGAIIDVFPMGSDLPIRIEQFDDTVDTLRYFDPESQRSLQKLNQVKLLPAKEYAFTEQAISQFRSQFRERFTQCNLKDCTLYQDISQGIMPAGIEYFLPLFFANTHSFFDYLEAKDWLVIDTQHTQEAIDKCWLDIEQRYENRRHDVNNPILAPSELFVAKDRFFKQLKHLAV